MRIDAHTQVTLDEIFAGCAGVLGRRVRDALMIADEHYIQSDQTCMCGQDFPCEEILAARSADGRPR